MKLYDLPLGWELKVLPISPQSAHAAGLPSEHCWPERVGSPLPLVYATLNRVSDCSECFHSKATFPYCRGIGKTTEEAISMALGDFQRWFDALSAAKQHAMIDLIDHPGERQDQ